ncbi:uncharacterized protein A1O5_12680 [Cladophialophora psammophila CBS 110553]|uniref:Pterin-binding domain-containing protein n=1 Tax=Cladophialophora psammophila CBS 110553 TaxID=1182543 RepID=W9WCH8_9EURO|nr:uncharacterized protein A1O5_12680 [Cladophialophora psammophila CBS 110553]EXJ56224.1 hypothetical protein A1O5_12680 [Cladophialophora psammophila CBS 110553]
MASRGQGNEQQGDRSAAAENPDESGGHAVTLTSTLVDINALFSAWTRLQNINHNVEVSQKESREMERFLWTGVDNLWHQLGSSERKCQDYYRAYTAAEKDRAAITNEIQTLTEQTQSLREDLRDERKLTNLANVKANELTAISTHLSERNILLEQELQECHQKIRILEDTALKMQAMERTDLSPKKITYGPLDNNQDRSSEARLLKLEAEMGKMEAEHNSVVRGYKKSLADLTEQLSMAEKKLLISERKGNIVDVGVESVRPSAVESSPFSSSCRETRSKTKKASKKGKKLTITTQS